MDTKRSNHFPDEALDRGFPDHISSKGDAHYSDGTVICEPSVVSDSEREEDQESDLVRRSQDLSLSTVGVTKDNSLSVDLAGSGVPFGELQDKRCINCGHKNCSFLCRVCVGKCVYPTTQDNESALRRPTPTVTYKSSLQHELGSSESELVSDTEREREKEIRERRAAISPAPWCHMGPAQREAAEGRPRRYVTRTVGCGDVPPEKFVIAILHWPDKPERDVADAEFIANAPADIDYLLTLVAELRQQVEVLEAFTNRIANLPNYLAGCESVKVEGIANWARTALASVAELRAELKKANKGCDDLFELYQECRAELKKQKEDNHND